VCVLSLQVATSQLKQGNCHILPGLTAVLIDLQSVAEDIANQCNGYGKVILAEKSSLQSHAIRFYRMLPFSQLPGNKWKPARHNSIQAVLQLRA